MVEIYHAHDGVPGYRMIQSYLKLEGIYISKVTAWKYMHELGLKSIVRRKKYVYISGKADHIYPNLLNRDFNVIEPNKVWCTDFTYMVDPETGKNRYNCTIIDLYRREAIATLNGPEITSELAIATLALALQKRSPGKGIILHSDRGSQFTAHKFGLFCNRNHVQQSMSAPGCPYDNAPMERFYNTFKNEYYNLYDFKSTKELDEGTYNFINIEYNTKRPHMYNNGMPPVLVA